MRVTNTKEVGSWEELEEMLWCNDETIDAVYEQGREKEAFDLINEVTDEWDIASLNDFVRFELPDLLGLF